MYRPRPRQFLFGALLAAVIPAAAFARAGDELEAPRVLALLAQAEAAELGVGLRADARLAASLYCDAARLGSAEAYFRLGRLAARPDPGGRRTGLANAYFALAARLGHHQAIESYENGGAHADDAAICQDDAPGDADAAPRFDLDAYVGALHPAKQKIAALIRRHAERHGVDANFALAVALAESNLETQAVSAKNAQGVMQLIPETQQRFGVSNAFNVEQNVRGGVAYLKWLQQRFAGRRALIAAAYNAGEGAVERHGGIPPYAETRDYVRRVLRFAGD